MNEHVSEMTLNVPPHFMNWDIGTHIDLTEMFRFFAESQSLLRDRPEISGQTTESDFEVVLEFTNLTGSEAFLNGQWLEETLEISFYAYRPLAQEVFDLSNEIALAYQRKNNPEAFPEVHISLIEVNWEELKDGGYQEHVWGITLDAPMLGEDIFNTAFFGNSSAELGVILDFLSSHQADFSVERNDEYRYSGSINFIRNESTDPLILADFYMNEQQIRELLGIIGEEAWEQARRQ